MKKLLAVFLSVICIFSCFALPASAAGALGVIGELANTFFEGIFDIDIEEDTPLGYGVIYEIDPLQGVSVVYKPSPSISFENPGTYAITTDTPLSIDYEFICWEDTTGKRYYAGDKIYVDGMITLYAIWVEKNDNDMRVARVIKTTFEALRRLIGKFLGIYEIVLFYEPDLPEKGVYDLKLSQIYYEDASFEADEGNERVLLYIDSFMIYQDNRMSRYEIKDGDRAKIYFCTGWHPTTQLAENLSETYETTYSFAAEQGTNKSDLLIINAEGLLAEYLEGKGQNAEKVYMVVTVEESLYSSTTPENGLNHNERYNPVSVVFTINR